MIPTDDFSHSIAENMGAENIRLNSVDSKYNK